MPDLILTIIGFPIFWLLFISFSSNQFNTTNSYVVISSGNQALKTELIEAGYGKHLGTSKAQGLDKLDKGEIATLYLVPKNYVQELTQGKKPKIERYARKKDLKDNLLESAIADSIKQEVRLITLKQQGLLTEQQSFQVNSKDWIQIQRTTHTIPKKFFQSAIMMVIYTTMLGPILAGDLVSMKKNRVLKRSVLSPNSNRFIISSYLLAHCTITAFIYSLIGVFFMIQYGLRAQELALYLFCILLALLIALSLGVLLFRLFKNPALCNTIGIFVWMLMIALAMLPDLVSLDWAEKMSYLSPFTWLIDLLDKQILFPNSLILFLMSGVLFTAGSYKLEYYVTR